MVNISYRTQKPWSWTPRCKAIATFALMAPLGLALISCQKKEAPETQQLARPVKVMEVQNTGVAKVVEFPGQINAVQKSWKAFEVPGRVVQRFVKEGENIKKDQVLARLDPRDYQYAYDSAKAQHEAAEQVATRFTELSALSDKRAVSLQKLDLAQRDLRKATAQLQQAKKALEDTKLIADFDGRVAQILIDDFTNVVAKENVMLIQDNSLLEIVVNLPESAVALPIKGETTADKVEKTNPEVILSVFPDQAYPATYREASEHPDPATRTYEVKLTFSPNDNDQVRPGMTAKVRAYIPANTTPDLEGFPVPVHALVSQDEDSSFVWKLDPVTRTVSKVSVTLGSTVDETTVVKGDLKNGDLIVISGVHQLRDCQQVKRWIHGAP
jgi:RND family efflux transporter MFP subunit